MHASRFHLRSYPAPYGCDRHAFAQWVLPLSGELEFELDGQGTRPGPMQGAFAAPGELHDPSGEGPNQHLIIDCTADGFDDATLASLRAQHWLPLPDALRTALRPTDESGHARILPLLPRTSAPAAYTAQPWAVMERCG